MGELENKFRRAVDAFHANDLVKAERILQQIAKSSRNIFDVEHLLGVVKLVQARYSEAEVHLKAAIALNGNNDEALSNYGYALKCLNRPQEALVYFTRALAVNPRNPLSYHNRGTILAESSRKYSEAIDQFDKAIFYNPSFADSYSSKGNCLEKLKRYEDALVAYDKALSIKPDLENAWLGRGNVFWNLKRYGNASAAYEKALSIKPDLENAWLGQGNVLTDLKRYADAVAAYDKALSIKPDLAEAWLGRGNVSRNLKRYDEAFDAYDKALSIRPDFEKAWAGRGYVFADLKHYDKALSAYDNALALDPNLEKAWLGRGNAFCRLKRYGEAFSAYDKVLSIEPDSENAWLGRGNLLSDLRRYDEAISAYAKALSIWPDLAEAWLGRGNVFTELKRYEEASAAYDKALSINPELAEAWLGRGNVLWNLKRYDAAFAAYDKGLSVNPDMEEIEGARLHAKMNLCNWDNLEEEITHLKEGIRAGKVNSLPFALLSLTDSPDDHLRCAKAWVAAKLRPSSTTGATYKHDKIRVGYVSPDFRQHPVGYLTAGIFENHDTSRFETYAFSIGPNDHSDLRERLERSFYRFIDCQDRRDSEVLESIKDAQIDILVDLAGYTQNARPSLFASSPAPLVVNFLGYAGTLGCKEIWNYVIADRIVLPESSRVFFEEKVVYLPGSFMPSDTRGRTIDNTIHNRADHDLRQEWTVFCCFNNAYKINRTVFHSWMNILRKVDESVLWLSDTGELAKLNLRKEAEGLGIDPDRLVFAKRLSLLSDHSARHRLANLFLDTLPYNAHTTASDALWAGLPVVTQVGNSLAGRVAASLLDAVGLPELITRTREEYEALAIELAFNKQKLQGIREKLQKNRLTTSLFDTALYAKHLEAAYEAMHQRYRSGLSPSHIEIEPLG